MRDYEGIFKNFANHCSDVCRVSDYGIMLRHPTFGRDSFPKIPVIRKQIIDMQEFEYLGFEKIRIDEHDTRRRNSMVGFFLPDKRFLRACLRPWDYVKRLTQYRCVASPDLSCYTDMSMEEQWLNVYWSRFVGSCWQKCGLTVIPTITWSDERSFEFCFQGVEKTSVIALSTNGCPKHGFMRGFKELCRRINPEAVICYCTPFSEMFDYAKIVPLEHSGNKERRRLRHMPAPGQMTLLEISA